VLAEISVLSTVFCQLGARVLNSSLSDFFAPTGVMRWVTRSFYFPYVCTAVVAKLIWDVSVTTISFYFLCLGLGTIQLLNTATRLPLSSSNHRKWACAKGL